MDKLARSNGDPAVPLAHLPNSKETFECVSGIMHYCLDGKLGTLTSGQTVVIKPSIPHTFWCDGKDGIDLEVLITVRGGPNPGFDGVFVRNFYGFLHSNALQDRSPNLFHALAYMYDADVILQDFPLYSGKLANYVGGLAIGKYVAGYKTEHDIYQRTLPSDRHIPDPK